jgi:hypothetical protein
LIISGGGDWGAFGAGVLKGWGKVQGDSARPQFDIVTGVSTGALIAPFAFAGDEKSIDKVVHLYRNPKPNWAQPRWGLYFWPSNESLYDVQGLEDELKKELDKSTLEKIVAVGGSGRVLIVNTTNVDYGEMRPWDLVQESRRALDTGKVEHLHKILLASSGIPGIFPPRMIDEHLYVDGAITGNIIYGGRLESSKTFWGIWENTYPNAPLPRVRYWVIFNNQFRFPPEVIQARWPSIISRATIMSTQTSTLNSIRHLYALAEIERLRRKAQVEVRVMSVPDTWIPPKPGTFDKEVMNSLADLGEKMGADPNAWRTKSP